MGIERLTPQDGSWTHHSLYTHQYGCAQMSAAIHQNKPCNILDMYDPCRTGSIQRSTPEVISPINQPWDQDISARRRERERVEKERRSYDQRTDAADQERYERMISRQSQQSPTPAPYAVAPTPPPSTKQVAHDIARETSRTAREEYRELGQIAQTAYKEEHDTYRLLEKELGLKPSDTIGRTLYQDYEALRKPQNTILGATVLGAANLVAAVATTNLTAFKADLFEAETKQLGRTVEWEEFKSRPAAAINTATSFKDYVSAVVDAKGYERAAKQEAVITRDQKIAVAESKRSEIETKYQQQAAIIKQESDSEQRDYSKKIQDLDAKIARIQNSPAIQECNRERQEKLTDAVKTYNHNKTTINEGRSAELAKIDTSTPIAAAQIREINRRFDAKITTLDTNYAQKVSKINSAYDERVTKHSTQYGTKIADLEAQKTQLTRSHQAAQLEFQDRLAGVKAERNTKLTVVQFEIKDAKSEAKTAKKEAKVEAKARSHEIQSIAAGNWHQLRETKAAQGTAHSAVKDVDGAFELKRVLVKNQDKLAQFLITNTGTAQEQQLVQAFLADKDKSQKCRAAGIAFTPAMRTLSDADTKQALKVLAGYGAIGLNSVKDNTDVVNFLQAQIPKLHEIAVSKQQAWTEAKQNISALQADQKALLATVGGKESKLSTADKQKLLKIKQDLSLALNKEKIAKKDAKESANMVTLAQSQSKKIKKHSELLASLGSRAKKPPRVNNKGYARAKSQLTRSLTGSLSAINRMTQKNRILEADNNFQKQVLQLRSHTDFAAKTIIRTAAIGTLATKMVFGLGKLGGKTLVLISSKSKTHQKVKSRLVSFALKNPRLMKVLNKSGSFIGGALGKGFGAGKSLAKGALFLPGKAIALANMSVLDAPAAIERKMASMAVDAGVGVLKHGGRLAVKGAVAVGRKPLKYGVRIGKAGVQATGQALGTGVRFVGHKLGSKLKQGASFVGKKAGSGVANAFRKTIGRSPLWEKTKALGKSAKMALQKAGGILGKIGSKILKPLKPIGSILGKIFGFLASIISGIASGIVAVISTLATAVLIFLGGAVILLIIMALLLAVLDAIFQFWYELGSEYQNYIKNDPSFIMNLGSNYRNTEISILEFFSEADGYTNNDKYDGGIEVNVDPLYYAVFNNSFQWFGRKDDARHKDINYDEAGNRNINTQAQTAYTTFISGLQQKAAEGKIKDLDDSIDLLDAIVGWLADVWDAIVESFGVDSTFGDVSTIKAKDFASLVTTYNSVGVEYYYGAEGQPGTTKYTDGVVSYEISNAKDAMAMMDAIYTMDNDMTRYKALKYLGVGEYQLAKHATNENKEKDLLKSDDIDNLFWASHNIVYAEGTKAADIKYHTSNSSTGTLAYDAALGGTCNNYSEIKVTYKEKQHTDGTCGDYKSVGYGYYELDYYNHNEGHHHYKETIGFNRYDTDTWTNANGDTCTRTYLYCDDGCCWISVDGTTSRYPNIYCDYNDMYMWYTPNPEYVPNRVCPHFSSREVYFKYCLGHIDLKAKIYVTVADPLNESAKTLFDVAKGLSPVINEQLGNGLWVWSKDLDIIGWGSPDPETFYPSTEWNDSALTALTESKLEEVVEYEADSTAKITLLKTKHGDGTNQTLVIRSSADDVLLHCLYFRNNVFHATDLKIADQKDMVIRAGSNTTAETTLSFKIAANGVAYFQIP